MNDRRREYADDLLERSRERALGKAHGPERYRNLEPRTAELLSVLVRACAPQRVLEVGTSNRYSTIWLADACEEIGAMLVSVDNDALDGGRLRATAGSAARSRGCCCPGHRAVPPAGPAAVRG